MNSWEVVIKHNIRGSENGMWVDGALHCSFCSTDRRDRVFSRHYMLIYVYDGYGELTIDSNQVIPLSAGSLMLFPPGVRQCLCGSGDQPLKFYGLVFFGHIFDTLLSRENFAPSIHVQLPLVPSIVHTMRDIWGLLESSHNSDDILLYSCLFSLLELCKTEIDRLKKHQDKSEKAEDPLEKAAQFIENNYHRQMKVSEICDHIGYCKSWLELHFKQRYGLTPVQYLMNVRVSHAKQFLHEDCFNISEACYATGFRDSLYFSKVFKKITGVSPSVYRQTSRKKALQGAASKQTDYSSVN